MMTKWITVPLAVTGWLTFSYLAVSYIGWDLGWLSDMHLWGSGARFIFLVTGPGLGFMLGIMVGTKP